MNREELSESLKDYHWMVNEITRQRRLLGDVSTKMVAQGGIESAMPKATGDPGDPVGREVIRRDKKYWWIAKLEDKVTYIQDRVHVATSEREIVILECTLDGMSITAIGKHTGLSRKHIYNIRDSIIDQMLVAEPSTQITHFTHFTQKMTNGNCLV